MYPCMFACREIIILLVKDILAFHQDTVDSKIFRELEISRVKKLILSAILWKNICQVMIFRLYTVYNKHEMIKSDLKAEKNRKYYRNNCSNNIAANCTWQQMQRNTAWNQLTPLSKIWCLYLKNKHLCQLISALKLCMNLVITD